MADRTPQKEAVRAARDKRLAAALRANLRRRKAAAKAAKAAETAKTRPGPEDDRRRP